MRSPLGMLLTGAGVRVAVINSCRAGAGGGAASSIAGALLRAGVPVVVAMQSEIPDTAAIAFCKSFYQAVALGRSVEQATTDRAACRVRPSARPLAQVGGCRRCTRVMMIPLFSANVNPTDRNSLASDRTARVASNCQRRQRNQPGRRSHQRTRRWQRCGLVVPEILVRSLGENRRGDVVQPTKAVVSWRPFAGSLRTLSLVFRETG